MKHLPPHQCYLTAGKRSGSSIALAVSTVQKHHTPSNGL